MKASEAKSISEQHRISLEKIFECVEREAKLGNSQLFLPNVDDEDKLKLINLGYELRQHIDPMGIKIGIISW